MTTLSRIPLSSFLLSLALGSSLAAVDPTTTPPALPHASSWMGNSFGIYNKAWVQNWIDDLLVLPDGTCLTNSGWDEGGGQALMYKDGKIVANPGHTHGWGHSGGKAVTANATYLFLAQGRDNEGGQLFDRDPKTWPPKGKKWFGISRRLLKASDQSAPFDTGVGNKEHLDKGFLVINEVTNEDSRPELGVTALVVDAANRLLVAVPLTAEIRLFNAETMAAMGAWSKLPRISRMAAAADGSILAIQLPEASTGRARIIHLDSSGHLLPQTITDVDIPSCLAFDRAGRLMVGDNGPKLQVRIYDHLDSTPKCIETLGAAGGILSGRAGELKPDKLVGMSGVGCDAQGNRYVSSTSFGSGTDLRCFAPDGTLRWNLVGPMFVDMIGLDPADDSSAWGAEERYKLDWTKREAGREWSYQAFTSDHFSYPEDIRKSSRPANVWVRRIEGKPILFMTDMYSAYLAIYRIAATSEIAVPAAMMGMKRMKDWPATGQPEGAYLWRDANGDGRPQPVEFSEPAKPGAIHGNWGWALGPTGDVWQAIEGVGLRSTPCRGLDAAGVPRYALNEQTSEPQPAPFESIQRLEYDAAHDVMYIGGFTAAKPQPNGVWGMVGTVLARYERWSTGNRTPVWTIPLPWGDHQNQQTKSMCVAGDYVFVIALNTQLVTVFHAASAAVVGTMTPGPEVGSGMGWIDIPHGIHAVKLKTGEYAVFVEEDANGKVLIYRWTPTFVPPAIALTLTPQTPLEGQPLTLTAAITAGSSAVRRVEFWSGETKLGEATAAPWSCTWPAVTAGRHRLTVRVSDAGGAVTPAQAATFDCGPLGKLWVDWDASLNGWWEAGGKLPATGRIKESREFSAVPFDCDLVLNFSAGTFTVHVRDGVARQIDAPGIGVTQVSTNHLRFTGRPVVVDGGAYAAWTQMENVESQRVVKQRRTLSMIPGPSYTLTGDFGQASFALTPAGEIVLAEGPSPLRVVGNVITVTAP